MCELLGLTSSAPVTANVSLPTLAAHGAATGAYADGWGVGFYEGLDVRLIKETTGAANSDWVRFIATHDMRSLLVVAHTRHATRGARSYVNAQPFVRELAGRTHLFAHNGDLPGIFESNAFQSERINPIGETDSERAFCVLLDRVASIWKDHKVTPPLSDKLQIVSSFAGELRPLGPANFLYSDGDFLFVHGHRRKHAETGRVEAPGLMMLQKHCQNGQQGIVANGITIQGDEQFVTLLASVPLTDDRWEPLAEGELVVVSRGQIAARQLADESPIFYSNPSFAPAEPNSSKS
jgi:predicted glutamine amidotransferase